MHALHKLGHEKKYDWEVEPGMEIDFEMPDWIYDLLIFGNINEDMKIIKKNPINLLMQKLTISTAKEETRLWLNLAELAQIRPKII